MSDHVHMQDPRKDLGELEVAASRFTELALDPSASRLQNRRPATPCLPRLERVLEGVRFGKPQETSMPPGVPSTLAAATAQAPVDRA